MQMQLVEHVTFFHAFIIAHSKKTETVGRPIENTQFHAGMEIWLPLVERVERANSLPRWPEAPRSL